jgi:hypothetical protein
MTDIAAIPATGRGRPTRIRFTTWQLRAYVGVLLDNIEQGTPTPPLEAIRIAVTKALQEFEDGTRDKLSVFFEIKLLEYRAARLLKLNSRELKLFITTDLSQTPATEKQIADLTSCFIGDDAGNEPVDDAKVARVTLLALAYWQQYADSLLKATRREKLLSIFLSICLTLYLSPLVVLGANELLNGTFISWFQVSSSRLGFLALGCAGAIVSMSLSVQNVAVMANRPLDDLYMLWSMVPRLLIGALAGVMAAQFIYIVAPVVNLPGSDGDRAVAMQVLQIFLAFSGGFADRLFLKKLVDATWKISGLTPANEKS